MYIYVYCSQKMYKIQFQMVTRFLITQSRSTSRGRQVVPDAKVISEKDTPKPRTWKLKLQQPKFESAFLLKHEKR